jgi:tetratricopeptide (TPR) repeat protein
VTGPPFRFVRLDEIEELSDGRQPWRPIRHELGITSFGINSWTARDIGDRIINEHAEDGPSGDEELYLVLEGHARFELDGEALDAPAGTLVLVQPEVKRTAFAEEARTTILAIGGMVGEAYQPFGWEVWAPINPLYQSGDYAGAAAAGRKLVEAHPEYPGLVYNLACCESLAGSRDDAIAHLRQAIDAAPRSREHARSDSDFDPIRDDPAFMELVAEP